MLDLSLTHSPGRRKRVRKQSTSGKSFSLVAAQRGAQSRLEPAQEALGSRRACLSRAGYWRLGDFGDWILWLRPLSPVPTNPALA